MGKNTMAVKSKSSRAPEETFKINVVQKDGDILVDQRPVLAPDSRTLFVASGCDVKVFSTGGEVIQELVGHQEKVIGIIQDIGCKSIIPLATTSLDKQQQEEV